MAQSYVALSANGPSQIGFRLFDPNGSPLAPSAGFELLLDNGLIRKTSDSGLTVFAQPDRTEVRWSLTASESARIAAGAVVLFRLVSVVGAVRTSIMSGVLRPTALPGRAAVTYTIDGAFGVLVVSIDALESSVAAVEGRASVLETKTNRISDNAGVLTVGDAKFSASPGDTVVDPYDAEVLHTDEQGRTFASGALIDPTKGVIAYPAADAPGHSDLDPYDAETAYIDEQGRAHVGGALIDPIGGLVAYPASDEPGHSDIDPYGGELWHVDEYGRLEGGGFKFDPLTNTILDRDNAQVYPPTAGSGVVRPSDPIVNTKGWYVANANAAAICAAYDIAPNTDTHESIYKHVKMLEDAGLWDLLSVITFRNSATAKAASLNWKSPATALPLPVAPNWRERKGSTGNGSSYGEDTGYSPAGDVNFNKDAFTFVVDVAASAAAANVFELGVDATLGLGSHGGSGARLAANDAGIANMGTGRTSAVGVTFGGRIDAATRAVAFDDGAAITSAVASTSIPPGNLKVFNANGFSSRRVRSYAVAPGVWLNQTQRAALAAIMTSWAKDTGSYTAPLTVGPPVVSSGPFVFTQPLIGDIEDFGSGVVLRINYGGVGQYLGFHGEGIGAKAGLMQSRDGGRTWTAGRLFSVAPADVTRGIVHCHIGKNPKTGAAIVSVAYSGSGGVHSIYDYVIENPTASPADWRMGPEAFRDVGFIGDIQYRNDGSLRTTASVNLDGLTPPYPAGRGCWFGTMRQVGDVMRYDRLSLVPPPTDSGINDFQEAHGVEVDNGRQLEFFRTDTGTQWVIVEADGVTWGTPQPLSIQTAGSQTCSGRSPYSNRIFMVLNDSPTLLRNNPTLVWTEPGANLPIFPSINKLLLDDSGHLPPQTYPSFAFETDRNGDPTGWVIILFDKGRGRDPSEIIARTELPFLRIHEDTLGVGKTPRIVRFNSYY